MTDQKVDLSIFAPRTVTFTLVGGKEYTINSDQPSALIARVQTWMNGLANMDSDEGEVQATALIQEVLHISESEAAAMGMNERRAILLFLGGTLLNQVQTTNGSRKPSASPARSAARSR